MYADLIASAVTGVPSQNDTPFRRLNVQTLLSWFGDHDSASAGSNWSTVPSLVRMRPSYIEKSTIAGPFTK